MQIEDPEKACFDTMLGSDLDDLNIVGRCSKLSSCVITMDTHTYIDRYCREIGR